MVAGVSKHELEIRAFVRDEVSKDLKRIKGELGVVEQRAKSANRVASTGFRETANQARAVVGQVTSIAAALGLFTAARGIKELAQDMSKLAAASEETRSAFDFVFGEEADRSRQQLEGMAQQVRRFDDDLLDAAVAFQFMLEPMSETTEQAAELSQILVQVGLDLGSLRDVAPAEATARLQSAIAGNTEALRTMVGMIAEADVANEAYRLGIAAVGSELTQEEKQLARISTVLHRVRDAIGDAERTKDSFTNTIIGLSAAVKTLSRDLGGELNEEIKALIGSAGGIEGVVGSVEVVFRLAASASMEFLQGLASIAALLTRIEGILGSSAFQKLADVANPAKVVVRSTPGLGALDHLFGLDKLASVPGSPMQRLVAAFRDVKDETEAAGAEAEDFTKTFDQMIAAIEPFIQKLREAREERERQARIERADDFRSKLSVQVLNLEKEIAATLEQQIRAEVNLHVERVNRLHDAAREQDIYEDIKGELAQIEGLMADSLRIRIESLQLADREAREAEERRIAEEQVSAEIQKHGRTLALVRGGVGDIAGAFGDLVIGANTFNDALLNIVRNIAASAAEAFLLKQAFNSLTGSGFISAAAFNQVFGTSFVASAKGNVFSGGDVVPFASGGVVSSPTIFPMTAGRRGLMGEAGPEAIMPLTRDSRGRLGVSTEGASSGGTVVFAPQITVNPSPGMDERAVARAVMAQMQAEPAFRAMLTRAKGVG